MPAKRYSWIVGENDNYDRCHVIIGDNRLTDRLFLIKLERLYFPVSDTPARNTCGSAFCSFRIVRVNFFSLSLLLFLSKTYNFSTPVRRRNIRCSCFFFWYTIRFDFQIFRIWDEDWIVCDLFVKKKKRREKSYGYGKRIRVKIKLVEVNHFWNSGRVKRSFDSLLVSTRKKNWSYFFFFIVACNKFSTCIKFTICREL